MIPPYSDTPIPAPPYLPNTVEEISSHDFIPHTTSGFPPGYFVIKSATTGKLLDVVQGDAQDGAQVVLWTEKEKSLVLTMRGPESDNQVFFIDYTGALCSKVNGHAIDIEDNRLVIRHRRPVTYPFPNKTSHPLPCFSYDRSSGVIRVLFCSDPSYPGPTSSPSKLWKERDYILTAIPQRKPRTITDTAVELINSAASSVFTTFSMPFGGPSAGSSTAHVAQGQFDLREEEVLEEERLASDEDDDSPAPQRELRVVMFPMGWMEKDRRGDNVKARERRKWIIVPLQATKTITKTYPPTPSSPVDPEKFRRSRG